MCRLLRDYLGVNFGTESQFIVRFHQRVTRYGDLTDDRRLRWLFEDISRERFFERTRNNFGFTLDIDGAIRSLEQRTYAAVLRAVFEQFAHTKGFERWGDKTPEYCRHLPVLDELFPHAQYIHIVRDGRDVAVSNFKAAFGPKNVLEAALTWSEQVKTTERFGAALPSGRFRTVRYEDLLNAPAETLYGVGAFLGIRNLDASYQTFAAPVRTRVWRDNAGKSRQLLSARETECFEALAVDVLDRFRYQLQYRRRGTPVTLTESACWRAKGMWQRASNPQFWTDNYYKVRLRTRDVMLSFLRKPKGSAHLAS